MSYRTLIANVMTANVTEIKAGEAATIDARGFTHLHVYPTGSGEVRWSSVKAATETSHGPDVQNGGLGNLVSVLVEANFYRVEALGMDVYVHTVWFNTGGLTVLDDSTSLGLAQEINFVGDTVFVTDLGGGRLIVRIGKANAFVYTPASIRIKQPTTANEVVEDASIRMALAALASEDVSIRIAQLGEAAGDASIRIEPPESEVTEDASVRVAQNEEALAGASILIEAPF